MTSKPVGVDILIVGAGPVGLFMANECARRKLKFRLVETRGDQSQHSKALAIFPRTMEIFDMAGVVKPFVEAANPVTAVSVITHDRRLAHLPFHPDESHYQYIAMVPQNVTESILADQLHRKGGTIEHETTFVSATQLETYVDVELDHNGTKEHVSAAFVIGCDGAHSKVRHILDLPFDGAQYDDLIMLADVGTNEALPVNELQLCPSELGPVAIFPISSTRRRIVATVERQIGESPSLELVQEILRQRAPAEFEASEIYWSSFFLRIREAVNYDYFRVVRLAQLRNRILLSASCIANRQLLVFWPSLLGLRKVRSLRSRQKYTA